MKVVSIHDPHLSRLNAEVEALKVQRDRAWVDYQTAQRAHTEAIFRRAGYIEGKARERNAVPVVSARRPVRR